VWDGVAEQGVGGSLRRLPDLILLGLLDCIGLGLVHLSLHRPWLRISTRSDDPIDQPTADEQQHQDGLAGTGVELLRQLGVAFSRWNHGDPTRIVLLLRS
jgi:hypothetical protein